MEPALPPFHPLLPRLLEHLKLEAIDAIKWNVLLCRPATVSDGVPTVILKFGADERKATSAHYEIRILRDVLPQIESQYFESLVLPEYVSDGTFEGVRWVQTRYIAGRPLLHDWSDSNLKSNLLGGKSISLAVAKSAVDVLRDLRMVDVEILPGFVRRFDFGIWYAEFRQRCFELVDRGLLTSETIQRATNLFDVTPTDRYEGNMFTNGDFYPRNFIVLPNNRIAVADWVGGVDPWEFVAMKAYVMMWGNPEWQRAYIAEINKHFPVDVEEMQIGLLVKCANRIWLWRHRPEEEIGLARTQLITTFSHCLDLDYVKEIFK